MVVPHITVNGINRGTVSMLFQAPKRKNTPSQRMCSRCGRQGHYSPKCYATTDTNGNVITDMYILS